MTVNGEKFRLNDMKGKVQKAINELNFRPQVSARKLASKEPQILAVAVPSFTTPFYNEVLYFPLLIPIDKEGKNKISS